MKLQSQRSSQRGFASILVIIVAGLMGAYLVFNTSTVTHVSKNLRLIERKQLRKFQSPRKAPPAAAGLPARPAAEQPLVASTGN